MKKIIKYLVFAVLLLVPASVFAKGDITVSPDNLTIEKGSTKTFTISADNVVGDMDIVSSDTSVATVDVNSWDTGMDGAGKVLTKVVTVTAVGKGTTTITLTIDAATYDEESLEGQTRTVAITVTEPDNGNEEVKPSEGDKTPEGQKVEENKENSVETTKKTVKNPKTGDGIVKYFVLSIVSMVLVIGIIINSKKKVNE